MTEVCGATSHIMMEVGGATSSVELLKVIRGIISGNFYIVVIDMRLYIS